MTDRAHYDPGPAAGARLHKEGDQWTLILVRDLRHSPHQVWQALTDPAQLHEWAPFDADRNLGAAGSTVTLTTVGAPTPDVTETTVSRAEAPRLLEYKWGGRTSAGSSSPWARARGSRCGTTLTAVSSRWVPRDGTSVSTCWTSC